MKLIEKIQKTLKTLETLLDDKSIEFIITGSCSLVINGLLNREPNDIDIILKCKDIEHHKQVRAKIQEIYNTYHENDFINDHNCITISLNNIKIDCLIVVRHIETCPMFGHFKLATPYETLKIKAIHTPRKYVNDLHTILNKITI